MVLVQSQQVSLVISIEWLPVILIIQTLFLLKVHQARM